MDIKSVDNNEVTMNMWQRELEKYQGELEKLNDKKEFLNSALRILNGLYLGIDEGNNPYHFDIDDVEYTEKYVKNMLSEIEKDINRVQTYIKHYQHEIETSKGDIE